MGNGEGNAPCFPLNGTSIAIGVIGRVNLLKVRKEKKMGIFEILSMAGFIFLFLYMVDH
jgi:hypothetical protein